MRRYGGEVYGKKWDAIALEDLVLDENAAASLLEGGERDIYGVELNYKSSCESRTCTQACAAKMTLYQAVDGIASDENASERNAAYL